MISVIIKSGEYENEIIINDKADINHLKNVFRMEKGDKLRAVDGENEYICSILDLSSEAIRLKIEEKNRDAFSIRVKIDAAISLIKNDKMELCIQKLTEIGINSIYPTVAKRCVVKLDKKKDKWDKIVKETMKQCQGVKPLNIMEVVKLKDIDFAAYDLIVVPYECEDDKTLKRLCSNLSENIEKILYIVGPEGGFEKEEIDFLKSKGANIVTLGKRILRAETASIVVGGILVNEFQ